MAGENRDWIAKQFAKGIAAEQALVKAERDHQDKLKAVGIDHVYSLIVKDDERHLDELKQIAAKYGHKEGGFVESAGGLLGGAKSAIESIATSDPFQTIGDDLMLKGNSLNYDKAWSAIFRSIGDDGSAEMMERAVGEDEAHLKTMLAELTNIGIAEAQGHEVTEKAA